MRSQRIPACRRQRVRSRDRGFVRLNGQRFRLGEYGSEESKEKYKRLIAEWESNGRQMLPTCGDLTVVELIAHFWQHAQTYYRRPDGTPTNEIGNYRLALRPLKDLYGRTFANDFGPKSLKAVQHQIVEKGWARTNINSLVSRVKHVFKWSTGNELVSPEVYHGLRTVPGLKRGRTRARETEPVRPAPPEYHKGTWAKNVQS